MSSVQRLEIELQALLLAAGQPPLTDAAPWRITSANLDIDIHRRPDSLELLLSGWRHSCALEPVQDPNEDEDAEHNAALALDLIGALLFGDLRILADHYNGVARRFTLQQRQGPHWRALATQGSRSWNPLARHSVEHHAAAPIPRPPRYRPRPVTALPWAPWAGLAGFYGAPAAGLPAELPVDGELDLHNFAPREIKPLVLAYIDACLARDITGLRIVHGKGVGNLRRTVHALLDRHPRVKGYRLGGHGGGSWGATLVDLSPELRSAVSAGPQPVMKEKK